MKLSEWFPDKKSIYLVYAAIVFPLYSWTTYWVLNYMPSWLMSMTVWETFSINVYAYAWTLIESLVLLSLILIFTAITPYRWLRVYFVSKGTILIWLLYVFSFVVQKKSYRTKAEAIAGIGLAVGAAICFFLIARFPQINRLFVAITDRLTIFLFIYLPVSVVSLFVILFQNLF